jgi:septation ring formation regulator EzrA
MTNKTPQQTFTDKKLEALRLHLETVDSRMETMDQRFSNRMEQIAENLEAVTHQIGVMSEGLTRLENASNKRDEQIDRLLGIVERLLPSGSS